MHSFQFLKLFHLIHIRITQPVLTVDMTVTANFHLIPSLVGHQNPSPSQSQKISNSTAICTTPILSTYDLNCNIVSPINKAVYFQSKMFMNGATSLHTFLTLDFLPVKSHNKQTSTQKIGFSKTFSEIIQYLLVIRTSKLSREIQRLEKKMRVPM